MKMGQEMVKKRRVENALKAYQTNPDDQTALNALAMEDPDMAFKFAQTRATTVKSQRESQQAVLEQNRDRIVRGAQLLREINPQDQAGWDQFLSLAQRDQLDISDQPRTFDPQHAAGIIKYADAFEPKKPDAAMPASVREFEYRNSLTPQQQAAYDRHRVIARPQIFGSQEGGYNVFDPNATPPSAPSIPQNLPTIDGTMGTYETVEPGEPYRHPDGSIRRKKGGQAAPPPATFPDRLAPL